MNLLRKTVVYFVNSLLLFILSWSGSVWAASSISNEVFVSTSFATYGVLFSQDGTTLYSFGVSLVRKHTLETAFDVSSQTSSATYASTSEDGKNYGATFNNDGTKLYRTHFSTNISVNHLSSAYDITSSIATPDETISVPDDGVLTDIAFNSDGTILYLMSSATDKIMKYTLSTPFDITSRSLEQQLATTSSTAMQFQFNSSGSQLLVSNVYNDNFDIYKLSSSFDLTTAVLQNNSMYPKDIINMYGMTTSSDDTKVYAADDGTPFGVYQYDISDFAADNIAPTVSSLSPADGAEGVATTANLVITFDEAVDVESGNITIKLDSDDSTVEAIDVTSGQVTGTGTTTITIDPTADLAEQTHCIRNPNWPRIINGTNYSGRITAKPLNKPHIQSTRSLGRFNGDMVSDNFV